MVARPQLSGPVLGRQTGRELWGSLLILLFSQGDKKPGHRPGVEVHTTPPSSFFLGLGRSRKRVLEKHVCVRLCPVCAIPLRAAA